MRISLKIPFVLFIAAGAACLLADKDSTGTRTETIAATQPAQLTAEQKAELEKLVAQLDSEDFKTRDAATQKLKDFGQAVVPVLREIAVNSKLSPEVKARIDLIIAPLSPLSVRIVPGRFHLNGEAELYGGTKHFHVVITNTGTKPINLWREWCSWGYFNLSFEIIDENGTKTTVSKVDRDWSKNFPDFDTLPPGNHIIFEVDFLGDKIWKNPPLLPQGKTTKLKMKAVYSSHKSADAEKNLIWTGTVCSPEETYTIYR
ncbi:MAG: hypothetical protein HZA50_12040 [Planctomycetes bacterium]|nr:hypothetical protein [Planctomycetota bacterium]